MQGDVKGSGARGRALAEAVAGPRVSSRRLHAVMRKNQLQPRIDLFSRECLAPTYPRTAALTRRRGLQGPRCRGRMPALMGLPSGSVLAVLSLLSTCPWPPVDVSRL